METRRTTYRPCEAGGSTTTAKQAAARSFRRSRIDVRAQWPSVQYNTCFKICSSFNIYNAI